MTYMLDTLKSGSQLVAQVEGLKTELNHNKESKKYTACYYQPFKWRIMVK